MLSSSQSESEMSARSVSPGPQPPEDQHVEASVVAPNAVGPNPKNSRISRPSLQVENHPDLTEVHADPGPSEYRSGVEQSATADDGLRKSTTSESVEPANAGLTIELCAGSAMLSACFAEQGWNVFPVDHSANRFHPLAKVCNLDLAHKSSWQYLSWLLANHRVAYIHVAPPCGTCSRAREIQRGSSDPRVLRTNEFPLGLPTLNGSDKDRVMTANAIYNGMTSFLLEAQEKNIIWSVENPKNSLLWEIPFVHALIAHGHFVDFDACCYGGERLVTKAFLTNCRTLLSLAQRCSGGHPHKPFGKVTSTSGRTYWATKDEAAYPRPLCQQIVALVSQFLQIGWNPGKHAPKATAAAALRNRQPRGRKCPPLVSEYKTVLTVMHDCVPCVDNKRRIQQPLGNIPAGARLLSSTKVVNLSGGNVEVSGGSAAFKLVLGVYHTKEEFVAKAIVCNHPMDSLFGLSDPLIKTMFEALTLGPAHVADKRALLVKKLSHRAIELDKEEKRLHADMPLEVARVLKGKRLLLLQEVAESLDWPDSAVFTELKAGFDLVGDFPHTGVFVNDLRPKTLSVPQLTDTFKYLKPALLGKVESHALDENSQELCGGH